MRSAAKPIWKRFDRTAWNEWYAWYPVRVTITLPGAQPTGRETGRVRMWVWRETLLRRENGWWSFFNFAFKPAYEHKFPEPA